MEQITFYNRWPTVEEVKAALMPEIPEAYFWFKGWDFHRPVIAVFTIASRFKQDENEEYVRVEVGRKAYTTIIGYEALTMVPPDALCGPINLPEF